MWSEEDNKLHRVFTFTDFKEAFAFMTAVAEVADRMNHHPTWINTYNKVEIWLNTHEEGDIVTSKDRELAKAIDTLIKQ